MNFQDLPQDLKYAALQHSLDDMQALPPGFSIKFVVTKLKRFEGLRNKLDPQK